MSGKAMCGDDDMKRFVFVCVCVVVLSFNIDFKKWCVYFSG